MEDIIIMDPEQTEYDQIDVYVPVQEQKQDIVTIEKIEEVEEESIKNESKQVNQSDIIISSSNGTYNINSLQISDINNFLDNYDYFLLWNNLNDTSIQSPGYVNLNDNLDNYDLICVQFKGTTSSSAYSLVMMDINDFKNCIEGSAGNRFCFGYTDQNYLYVRDIVSTSTNNKISIDRGRNCYNNNTDNSKCIVSKIYGLSYKTLNNNDVPIVSGNNIYYNYNIYCGSLSDDSLSNNLLNKPLNNYSVSESILLFIFMGLFVAGFSWFIKKNIFKL